MRNKRVFGFTLIELLVVMAIISILSVVAVVVYRSASNSANDTRKKGDINAIASAYEMKFNSGTAKYQVLANNDFQDNTIPVPPGGENYNGIISSETGAFRVCTVLSNSSNSSCSAPSDSCFCVTSKRGTYTGPAIGWIPEADDTWQIKLIGPLEEGDYATAGYAFMVDWEDTTKAMVDRLHTEGKKAICYVSVGSAEQWHSDYSSFPPGIIGTPLPDYDNEWYLDISKTAVLEPIMKNRFQICKDNGFDAVKTSNVDGYDNPSGFPLTYQNQIDYNKLIAQWVHEKGMSVALGDDFGQVDDLVDYFDFSITQECFRYDKCDAMKPFIDVGKPVFDYEVGYSESSFESDVCTKLYATTFNTILKNDDMDIYRYSCTP